MGTFKPKKVTKSNAVKEIKDKFLNGAIIRHNANDEYDLFEREEQKARSAMSGILGNIKSTNKVYFRSEDFYQAISELENEGYIMHEKSDSYSGCCQYHVCAYFLE